MCSPLPPLRHTRIANRGSPHPAISQRLHMQGRSPLYAARNGYNMRLCIGLLFVDDLIKGVPSSLGGRSQSQLPSMEQGQQHHQCAVMARCCMQMTWPAPSASKLVQCSRRSGRPTSSAGLSARRGATGIAREPLRVGRSNSAKVGMSLEARCDTASEASLGCLEDCLLPLPAFCRTLQAQAAAKGI